MARSLRDTFIPRDKPRSWVLFLFACLAGFAVGAVALAASWFHVRWLSTPAILLFYVCWFIAIVCWGGYLIGRLCGRYDDLQARPWSQQIW